MMTYDEAKKVLGESHVEWLENQPSRIVKSRASGAWIANLTREAKAYSAILHKMEK